MEDYEIRCGHVLDVLPQIPAESIQTVCTSPPYWGLRSYGTEPQIWGGEKDCGHVWREMDYIRNNDKTAGDKQRTNCGSIGRDTPALSSFCQLCGAWRGELGLEPTPDCGRLYMELRHDITEKEKAYVLGELRALGLIQ